MADLAQVDLLENVVKEERLEAQDHQDLMDVLAQEV